MTSLPTRLMRNGKVVAKKIETKGGSHEPRSAWRSYPLIGVFFFLMLAYVTPLSVRNLSGGLDPSWVAALSYALEKRLSFGVDVIFTGGPLSPLYHRGFAENYAITIVALSLAVTLHLSYLLASICGRISFLTLAVLLALVAVAAPNRDVVLMLPSYLLVVYTSRFNSSSLTVASSAIVIAATILAKFSVLPIALASLVLTDGLRWYRSRNIPVAMPVAAGATLALSWLVDQDPKNVLVFLSTSLDIASGFAPAMGSTMGTKESAAELLAWTLAAGIAVALLTKRLFPSCRAAFLVEYLATLVFLWLAFKAGFVRHDLHSLAAWSALTWVALLQLACPDDDGTERNVKWTFASLAVMSIAGFKLMAFGSSLGGSSAFLATTYEATGQALRLINFVISPADWRSDMAAAETRARAAVAKTMPLPKLDGTVDAIPSVQSILIANNLSYNPRPSIQEYAAYTMSIIKKNQAFFSGPSAPDYLLFTPGSIDGRHPASAEGASWPIFLSRYLPVEFVGNDIILKRRTNAIRVPQGEVRHVQSTFNERVSVDNENGPIYARVGVRLSLLGKLASLIYKPAIATIEIYYVDGSTRKYRINPDQATMGFLLSPEVRTAADYVALHLDASAVNNLPQVRELVVQLPWWAQWQYQTQIQYEFQVMELSRVQDASATSQLIHEFKTILRDTTAITSSNRLSPPYSEWSLLDGVFAHARSELKVKTGSHSRIEIEFGLRPGAYENGNATDGVCFNVRSSNGSVLFERCLRPVQNSSDRGVQRAEFPVPANEEIELITDCGGHCSWDWSYWKAVRLN